MKIFLNILLGLVLIYSQITTAEDKPAKAGTEALTAEAENTEKQVQNAACKQQDPGTEEQDFTAILECDCKIRSKTERSADPYWKESVKGEGKQVLEAINDAIAKCDQIKEDAPNLYKSTKLIGCGKIELLPVSSEAEN